MEELAAARVEIEAAAAVNAACVAAAELEALCASSTDNSVSAEDDRDNDLKLAREAVLEQAAQWATVHPQGRRRCSPDGCGHVGYAPGGGTHVSRAPDGGGSPDRHRRAGDWVDEDHDFYRRHDSPSPDWYHVHRGI
jgi:hypothetical protein